MLDSSSRLPISFKKLIIGHFQCKICQQIIVPPAIATQCRQSILGCSSCVNKWYSGEEALTKTCPACRADRGYNGTMILRGLDQFLIDVKKVCELDGLDNKD